MSEVLVKYLNINVQIVYCLINKKILASRIYVSVDALLAKETVWTSGLAVWAILIFQ
jgi:hypothetical protein